MNHHGYIYQACNFTYTGATKRRTDKYVGGGRHSRHYDKKAIEEYRVVRSAKHRYIYFCGSKTFKKYARKKLKYTVCDYPKGNNKNYTLGYILESEIIKV